MKKFGDYILEESLAKGGMAEVFLARKEGPAGFSKRVAIKCMHAHLSDLADFRSMFLDEARLVAKLTHANIAQLFDMGESEKRLFLAMEYIDGQALSMVLAKCRTRQRRIPPALAAHICSEFCLGLDYAHNFKDESGEALNIIHRDISPQNIMLTQDGLVKVVDFGIARAASNFRRTKAAALKGKLSYMSPEQVEGKRALDRRTDVYSCGVVLFEMLCMRLPHQAKREVDLMHKIVNVPAPDVRKISPSQPPELARIIRRALERDRDQRYPDCRSLRSDLLIFLRKQHETTDSYALMDFLQDLEEADPRAQRIIVPSEPRSDTQARAEAMASGDATRIGTDADGEESTARWWLFVAVLVLLGLSLSAFLLMQEEEPVPVVAQPLRPSVSVAHKTDKPPENKPSQIDQDKAPSLDKLAAGRRNDGTAAKKPDKKSKSKKKKPSRAQKHASASKVSKLPLQKMQRSKEFKRRAQNARDARLYNKAIRLLKKALQQNPNDLEIHFLLADTFARMDAHGMALQHYKTYLKKCPGCFHAGPARRYMEKFKASQYP